ncbi:hypothetical protein HYY74_01130 [Candidatus Woesearchaeota archaeon]|nr:hypothetical protein [Candidatus Woesearchaeota archaeon]
MANLQQALIDYFASLNLARELPVEKLLAAADNTRLRDSLQQFPNGIRDQWGEDLYSNMRYAGPHGLTIIFIGNGHIPYFFHKLESSGFANYLISSTDSHSVAQIAEDQNGLMYILETLRKYGIQPVADGCPLLVVGDTHGMSYDTPFPDAEKLRNFGVEAAVINLEAVQNGIEPSTGFWGLKNVIEFSRTLSASEIKTILNGLEPPDRQFPLGSILKTIDYTPSKLSGPKLYIPGNQNVGPR